MDRLAADVIDPARSYPRRPWSKGWTPAGVIACLEPLVNAERLQRLRSVLGARIGSVTLLLDAPHDPHNGAAILRSADAFGIPELHLVARRKAFLASNVIARGTERWVDVIEHTTAASAVRHLTERGFELVTTHPRGELLPEDLQHIPRLALVMGNEREGISEDLAHSAGRSVRIPMIGFVESLNVSVSSAILLREATRARPPDLSPEERLELYAQGLFRSVKQARLVLAALSPS